jgi:triosephosphate isomerase
MVGHSERRLHQGESLQDVQLKVQCALQEPGLNVLLCVGETRQEYQEGKLADVIWKQLSTALRNVPAQYLRQGRIMIAYEPIWAIGTGHVASPVQAQQAHSTIRTTLAQLYGGDPSIAQNVRIQYGGSVSPQNIQSLMCMPQIDGALVGGASLTSNSFKSIIHTATSLSSPFFSTY